MKFLYRYLFFLFCCLLPYNAYSMAKFDVSATVGNVTDKITTIAEDVQAKIKGVAETLKGSKFINAAKEGFAKIKDLKDKATNAINQAKQQVSDTMGAVKDTVDSVNESVNTLKDGVAQSVGNIVSSSAAVISNLQSEQSTLQSDYQSKIATNEAERDSIIKKHQENIKILEEMKKEKADNPQLVKEYNDKIQEANAAIKKAQEECQVKNSQAKEAYDEQNNKLEEQIKSLVDASSALNAAGDATSKAKDAAKSLFGKKGAALNKSISENFYNEDEQENVSRNAQIENYRRKIELEDTTDAYYKSITVLAKGDESEDKTEDLRSNAQVTDTMPAAIMMDTSILVEQMRSMLQFAKLQIADLKSVTAREMVKLPRHLTDYNTLMESNLDVYKDIVKKKKESLSLGDLKDAYNDAKSTYDDVKNSAQSMYDDAKAAYDDAKSMYDDAKNTAQNAIDGL